MNPLKWLYWRFVRKCLICGQPLKTAADKSYGKHVLCVYGTARPDERKLTY